MYKFSSSTSQVNPPVTQSNYQGFVDKYVNRGQMGSTKYAPFIHTILNELGVNLQSGPKPSGFMSKLFGGGKKNTNEPKTFKNPVYVIVVTDGDNDYDDKDPAREAIRAASNYGVFFQFVGIGNARFNFLKELDDLGGRLIDNANFFEIKNINAESDESLYDKLLTEFPGWIPQAKAKNLIY